MLSTVDYFDRLAGEYRNISAYSRRTLRGLFYWLKWYPLHEARRLVLAETGRVSGLRVLDLGCGVGDCAVALAARGASVCGVDLSTAMLAHARRRAASADLAARVEFVQSDGLSFLTARREPFDLTIAIGVFDYVADAPAWLRELARLSPSLVATFPRPSPLQSAIDWQYRRIGMTAHVYDIAAVRGWAGAAGYPSTRVVTPTFGGHILVASRP